MTEPNAKPARTDVKDSALSEADLMRDQRLQRNLKILIGAMTVLLLAGLGAVAYRIITGPKSADLNGAPSSAATTSATATALHATRDVSLDVPAGARIVTMALDGNRLAIHHDGPEGRGIIILDLASGQRLSDIKLRDAVPKN